MRSTLKYSKGEGEVTALVVLAIFGFIIWGVFSLIGGEQMGVVDYHDCRQTIDLKEGDWSTFSKKFTCNLYKAANGKILGGECVHVDLSSDGRCEAAYIYQKEPEIKCLDIVNGYLNAEGQCMCNAGYSFNKETSKCEIPLVTRSLPTQIGECVTTEVKSVGSRLTNQFGQPIPGSGSAITYTNEGYQVSYDEIYGINSSQTGDQVVLCLLSVPTDCPPGDDRGKIYKATNLRTTLNWEAPDSEHSCGGM